MAYPVLAPKSTWFAPNVSTVTRASITEIEIMDSYTPDSSATVVDQWDASVTKDGSITCYVIGTKLIIAGNGSGKIAMNADSEYLFSDIWISGVTSYDYFGKVLNIYGINLFSCDNVITLSRSFSNMTSLTELDLSSWNTSKVTNISGLIVSCSKLTTINLQNWTTEQFTDISVMFRGAAKLSEAYGLDRWELPNLEKCWGCFDQTLFTKLDLRKWNVSKVNDFQFIAYNMPNLIEVDISTWDMSRGTTIKSMFAVNPMLTKVIVPNNWNVPLCTNAQRMFMYCSNLETIDTSSWNMPLCTDMSMAFLNCQKLETIDLSNWDVSSVTTFEGMFENCSRLSNIDVSNWKTVSCTNMAFMFYSCSSLKEIDVSKWDVSKVTNFDHFAAHANLKCKGIENWKTTSAVNMNALFHNCAEEELDLSGWDVSKVQFFCQMFENSPNLKRIKGLEKWDTSAGLGFDGMFERCSKLEEVDLSSFDTSKAKNGVAASTNGHKTATMNNMFLSCNNLKKVKVGPNFSVNGDGTNTTAANKTVLPTPSTDYIAGADGNWYAFNGEAFAPNAIKDKTAETYFASYALCADQDIIVKNGSMIDTAKAIREKNGANDHYTPAQFGAAIRALS